MEDPVERRKRLRGTRRTRRDNPEMAQQMRNFRKSAKVRYDKNVKEEIGRVKELIEDIKRLERYANEIIAANDHITGETKRLEALLTEAYKSKEQLDFKGRMIRCRGQLSRKKAELSRYVTAQLKDEETQSDRKEA